MENQKREVLDSIKREIAVFTDSVEKLSSNIRLEKGYDLSNFKDIFESIEMFYNGILLTEDLHGVDINGYELASKLDELIKSIQSKDDVYTADLLEYELLPALKDIADKLAAK